MWCFGQMAERLKVVVLGILCLGMGEYRCFVQSAYIDEERKKDFVKVFLRKKEKNTCESKKNKVY